MIPETGTIAALLFRRVGDSLLSTPALRAIKGRHPRRRLCVICEPQVSRVFDGLPYIDQIISIGPSPGPFEIARLFHSLPNVVATVDFLSDPRTAIACRVSNVPVRVGFGKSWRALLYTHAVPMQDVTRPVYSATHKLGLASTLDARYSNVDTDFALREENISRANEAVSAFGRSGKPIVAFFVTSRREYKRWSAEKFREIANAVQASGKFEIALVGGKSEEGEIKRFASLCELPAQRVTLFSDLGDFAAFLKECALFVGNDGGPKHLAVAVGIPTITVFRNDPVEYWTPPSDPRHVAVGGVSQDPSASHVLSVVRSKLGI